MKLLTRISALAMPSLHVVLQDEMALLRTVEHPESKIKLHDKPDRREFIRFYLQPFGVISSVPHNAGRRSASIYCYQYLLLYGW